ncbi:DNRLRE domain-containing protein [Bacillus chungangensis]|uniref:Carbohydrate-binding module family 96 domain-containing protein n=1 Tax=Bacillus chungangensis TaxID=587633 RepID=A0ABT9WSE7_9BACI|nr:DNRLRE domain-containing protein [Bacillus chungangensis]MDQ0176214.1 hypothetical protein [Bacillus chungangensis]
MAYTKQGLLFHLHAALANEGQTNGTNNDPTVEKWYDLSHNGRCAKLVGYDFKADLGWRGSNIQGDPYSLHFNGLNNRLEVDDTDSLWPHSDFSYEVQFRPIGGTSILTLGRENEQGFSLSLNKDFELIASIRTSDKRADFHFGMISANAWQYVTVTYDHASGRLWGFLNGAPQGFSLAQEGNFSRPTSKLVIGEGFRGFINTVRLYDYHLDFDGVAFNVEHSSLYIEDDFTDLPIKGIVPWRNDLASSLHISISGTMSAKYDIMHTSRNDLSSEINITTSNDLESSMDVNSIAFIKGRYDTLATGSSNLEATIAVKHAHDLRSSAQVNPSIMMRASYDIEHFHLEDLPAAVHILSDYVPEEVVIDYPDVVFFRASYQTHNKKLVDLDGSIHVKKPSDLQSGIKVALKSYMIGKYDIDERQVEDLFSHVTVKSTNNLLAIIKVPSTSNMTAKYGTNGIMIDDFPANIIVPHTADLSSMLHIEIRSIMTAKYDVSPIFGFDMRSVLGIKEFYDLPSSFFINLKTNMSGRYVVEPLYFDLLPSTLTINETSNLPSSIGITPETRMVGSYGVMQRQKATMTLTVNKDAYVREFFPRLNYGTDSQMYVGRTDLPFPERFRAYLGFDLSRIPIDNTEIGKAVLKIYYDGRGNDYLNIFILEPTANWEETSITWAGQPAPNFNESYDGNIATKLVGGKAGIVEIDVSHFVKNWHEGKPNFGFVLQAVDERVEITKGFATKESIERRPELEVTYYDMHIYSMDTSSLLGRTVVQAGGQSDLKGKLYVRDNKGTFDIPANLFVHNHKELYTTIWINKPQLASSLTVSTKDFYSLSSVVSVRQKGSNDLDIDIKIHERNKPSDIYVLYRSNLPTDISIRRWGNPATEGGQIAATLAISEANKNGSLYVKHRIDIASSLDVRRWSDSNDPRLNLTSEMEITRRFELPCRLEVMEKVQLDGTIAVNVWGNVDQPSDVYVLYRDDLSSSGNIGNPNLKAAIEVWEKSLLDGEMTVRKSDTDSLVSTIKIPVGDVSLLPSRMNLRLYKDVPGIVTVLSGNLASSISVPRDGKRDVLSNVAVSVRRSSDLESSINIVSKNLACHITVRRIGGDNKVSSLIVRRGGDDDLSSDVFVRSYYSISSFITVRRSWFSNVGGELSVRVNGLDDHESHMSVRRWNEPFTDGGQLESNLTVRVWSEAYQSSTITIRRTDEDDLDGRMDIWYANNLPARLNIRQTGFDDLPSVIAVYELNELFGDITVRKWGDSSTDGGQIDANITVRQYHESIIVGRIAIYEHDSITTQLTVRQVGTSDLPSTIAIQKWSQHNQPSTIILRQKEKSNLRSYLSVRRSDRYDLPVDVCIKRVSDLEGHILVVTAYPYAYMM